MLRIYNSAFDNLLLLLTYGSWDHILVKLGHNFKWLKKPNIKSLHGEGRDLIYSSGTFITGYSIGAKKILSRFESFMCE